MNTVLGSEVPTIAIRFGDVPEGPKKCRITIILMVMVYCSYRLGLKLAKEKGVRGQCPEETRIASSCLLPVTSHRLHLVFPAVLTDDWHEGLPIRKA